MCDVILFPVPDHPLVRRQKFCYELRQTRQPVENDTLKSQEQNSKVQINSLTNLLPTSPLLYTQTRIRTLTVGNMQHLLLADSSSTRTPTHTPASIQENHITKLA